MSDYPLKLSIQTMPLDENKLYQIIKFKGDLDKAGLDHIKMEIENLLKDFKGNSLVFDFEEVKFINSESIGFLMEIHTHLAKLNKKLILVKLMSNVKDVLETIGMLQIVNSYDSLESFTSKL